MNVPRPTGSLRGLEDNVLFWQSQSARLERDRKNLIYLLYAAAPVALLLHLASHLLWLALAGGGVCLSAFGLGLYMVTVRRDEYAFALREAETELATAQKGSASGPA